MIRVSVNASGGSTAGARAALEEAGCFDVHLARVPVSIDGEIATLPSPLEYRMERDALRIVVSAAAALR